MTSVVQRLRRTPLCVTWHLALTSSWDQVSATRWLQLKCFSFKASQHEEVGEEESGAIWRKVAPLLWRHQVSHQL